MTADERHVFVRERKEQRIRAVLALTTGRGKGEVSYWYVIESFMYQTIVNF